MMSELVPSKTEDLHALWKRTVFVTTNRACICVAQRKSDRLQRGAAEFAVATEHRQLGQAVSRNLSR